LFKYLALILSEAKYQPGEESMSEYIRDAVARLFSTKRLKGPLNSVSDAVMADFYTILEHMPVDKCEYIIDSINNFINDESSSGRQAFLNNRLRLKIGELAAKYFTYKHDQGPLLIQLTDQLVKYKFFDNVDAIRKMESIQ
jgi:hypothetical protein